MLTEKQNEKIKARLLEMLVGQLQMRWPTAHAYIPPGGIRIHCAQPLSEADQKAFDLFTLGYQEAMNDMAHLLGSETERPIALILAESSAFQGGSTPTTYEKRRQSGGDRPRDRNSDARAKLEALFKRG